jgi:triosephosphate isomerase
VLAYEPVWAIGTGRACDASEANRVCGLIRSTIREVYGEKAGAQIRVLYGGSVTEENAHDLISQSEIDGGLVGGASLNPVKFAQIVHAASVIAQQMRYT